jgi:hypothetical protein
MNRIAQKSAGQLIDELVTNAFKIAHAKRCESAGDEYEVRHELLRDALEEKLGHDLADAIHDLAIVSYATWQAQEIVMHERDDAIVARAGRQAQRSNARRTSLIREIDRVLGEVGITITTKTY